MSDAAGLRRAVIVTDGDQRAALATVRSLGRAGNRVHVCASRPRSLAAASRYCTRDWIIDDPLSEPDAFCRGLVKVADEIDATAILPITEPSLLAVLPHRDAFRGVIPFPSAEAFRRVCDKALVLGAAPNYGIRVPTQVTLDSEEDLEKLGVSVVLPVVIKPSRSIVGSGAERSKTNVLYADCAAELAVAIRSLPAAAFPVLLQERVEGPGFALSVLLWDGELRAAFAHRRIREKPPSGGVSVLREGIPLDPELLDRSLALLTSFDWQGVAMVEYKLHEKTGVPYLMEINGRLWGSLQLAIDAGVDFPNLLLRAAFGERYPAVTRYAVGSRTRWEWGDVDHLLSVLRHSREALALPRSAPGRIRTLASFLATFASGAHTEVFRVKDPLPFVRESLNWVRGR